jgi:predicted Zn-dependent protease
LQPNVPDIHFCRSIVHELSGNVMKAIEDARVVLELDPEVKGIHFRLARLLVKADNAEEAQQILTKVCRSFVV